MNTIQKVERERGLQKCAARFRSVAPTVKGAVVAVMLRDEIVQSWSWILLRCSRDIEDQTPGRLADDLREDETIKGIVERIGARTALPLAYDESQWRPTPKVEFLKSHVTGHELPNPFATGDVADQIFVRKTLGESFANELEISARGGRTYREEFERQNEVRLGGLIRQWPADAPNPYEEKFAPGDMFPDSISWQHWRAREIKKIESENEPLAAWLKLVAKPQVVNPFIRAVANVTRQMEVTKVDAPFAGLLRRAAQWQEAQLENELAQAEHAATAARAAAAEATNAAAMARAKSRLGR